MLSEHTVAAAALAAGIDAPVHFAMATGSTNTDLWRLAEEGAPEWTVFAAGTQDAGRGRLGRTWTSLPGESLFVSVLLRPVVEPADAPLVSLAAAVAMTQACRGAGVDAGCKWPNDVLAGGRKLGGVLPEASVQGQALSFLVLGTGVNCSQVEADFPAELLAQATSLAREGGDPDPGPILERYLRRLRELYGDRGGDLGARVLEPYREACVTLGHRVRAITTGGMAIEPIGSSIAADSTIQTCSGWMSFPTSRQRSRMDVQRLKSRASAMARISVRIWMLPASVRSNSNFSAASS